MRPEHYARCEQEILKSGVSKAMAGKLIDAGYQTPRILREASDEELLAIEGVGQATVDKVRVQVGR